MSLESDRSDRYDLEGQLEASHAEVAHMQQQIAATTAAVATARRSDIAKGHYPVPGDADYSEDKLIRYRISSDRTSINANLVMQRAYGSMLTYGDVCDSSPNIHVMLACLHFLQRSPTLSPTSLVHNTGN